MGQHTKVRFYRISLSLIKWEEVIEKNEKGDYRKLAKSPEGNEDMATESLKLSVSANPS